MLLLMSQKVLDFGQAGEGDETFIVAGQMIILTHFQRMVMKLITMIDIDKVFII